MELRDATSRVEYVITIKCLTIRSVASSIAPFTEWIAGALLGFVLAISLTVLGLRTTMRELALTRLAFAFCVALLTAAPLLAAWWAGIILA